MFPIDSARLPALATRRALLVIDPQNDFLQEDGALPIRLPFHLPARMADFATDFRKNGGEVIWVYSQFESSRPIQSEQIMPSDTPMHSSSAAPVRGRRMRTPTPEVGASDDHPEAFLTQQGEKQPRCVRIGSRGVELHPAVAEAMGPRDHLLVKSHYSAFKSEQLLRVLRTRFVTEVFIIGVWTNIGIMATAIDAASHGYAITIVDDCCGFQSMLRHRIALQQISDTTGCSMLTAKRALESFAPVSKSSARPDQSETPIKEASRYPTVRGPARGKKSATASSTSNLASSFGKLSLNGLPIADKPNVESNTPAPTQPVQPLGKTQEGTPDSDEDANNRDVKPTETVESPATDTHGLTDPIAHQVSDGGRDTGSNDDESHEAAPRVSGANEDEDERRRKQSRQRESHPNDDEECKATMQSQVDQEHKEPTREAGSLKMVATKPPVSVLSKTTFDAPSNHTIPIYGAPDPRDDLEQAKEVKSTEDTIQLTEKIESTMEPLNVNPNESAPLCEGDTKVIFNALPQPLADSIFEKVRDEVRWQRMSHQGGEVPRLVAVQGEIGPDGSMPIYRHPADESPPLCPFSPVVRKIKNEVEKKLGHSLNHVLIQFYRHGNDYISEHSDKTLDIARGTFIANVSLGAERTMTFRTKRPPRHTPPEDSSCPSVAVETKRQVQRARLPHNSICQMGLVTNMRWLHAIRADKRLEREKSEAELAYDGGRISLTFRQIGTFLDRDNKRIWGQGAKAKNREDAGGVVNGQTPEAVAMLQAFGRENQSTEFDWEASYGAGFDVLHISTAPRLFLSTDPVVNMRIQFMLAEYGVSYARGSMTPQFNWKGGKGTKDPAAIPEDLPVKFVDNDPGKSTVLGETAIMLYLDRVYGQKPRCSPASGGADVGTSRSDFAKQFTRFQSGLHLLPAYRASLGDLYLSALKRELAVWNTYAAEDEFIAGPRLTLADFAVWPVLHLLPWAEPRDLGELRHYYERLKARASTKRVLDLASGKIEVEQ
ncbi:hypothetical protein F4778DRAFT_759957 [Xylariomycetidae sp. FL2044]|nr:hypothetical protein F4778DRAFT_766474 [Xylariomycetidae sp. FL2044]KAH9885635.1 hypothetical protein F4778DRAFT_759957 [Xylariomycetidae sp. FL2044]